MSIRKSHDWDLLSADTMHAGKEHAGIFSVAIRCVLSARGSRGSGLRQSLTISFLIAGISSDSGIRVIGRAYVLLTMMRKLGEGNEKAATAF